MLQSPRDSEYFDEWLNRDTDLADMCFEEYDYLRNVEDYGFDKEQLDSSFLQQFY